jgi:hypothetical protein
LGVGFERCKDKGEKCVSKFVPSSHYHKEQESLKPTKTHYPSNPKPSFNPKRGLKKNTPNPSEDVYICMFCGRAGHLDEHQDNQNGYMKCMIWSSDKEVMTFEKYWRL